ncbi:MAG: hypothetical protein SFU91_03440 [Chloroherpetonaceae bacterium]|nr:hypothetical protein [Chloroherpetonaceae bacterium]
MRVWITGIFVLCIFLRLSTSINAQAIEPKSSVDLKSLTIYATGNTNGYLEPCPCSKELLGGVAIRAGIFQPIRRFQPSLHNDSLGRYYLLLDAGNRLSAHRKLEAEASAIGSLFQKLNYDALNIGWQDLRLGARHLKKQKKLPFVAANIFDAKGKSFLPKYRILKRGKKQIAIIGILSKDAFMLLDSLERKEYFWIKEDSAIGLVLQELNDKTIDAVILLSNSYDPEVEKKLLFAFPKINGMITTSEIYLKEESEVLKIGETERGKFIVSTGHDGEFVSSVKLSTHRSHHETSENELIVEAMFPILLKPYLTKDESIQKEVKMIQKKFETP